MALNSKRIQQNKEALLVLHHSVTINQTQDTEHNSAVSYIRKGVSYVPIPTQMQTCYQYKYIDLYDLCLNIRWDRILPITILHLCSPSKWLKALNMLEVWVFSRVKKKELVLQSYNLIVNMQLILQNSASPSSRGRLLYIHPLVVVGCRNVLSPLILPP